VWAAKNSPRFAVFNFIFCSVAQTPLPLIHPADSVFGVTERGKSQNQDGGDWTVVIILTLHTSGVLAWGEYALRAPPANSSLEGRAMGGLWQDGCDNERPQVPHT